MTTASTSIHRRIWQLAWPMILSNISIPLFSLVDAAILGHLERASYLAAVALGGAVLSFVYWGFSFLRMGTTGLAAQAFGAQDHNNSPLIIGQSIVLGLALSLLVLRVSPLLLPQAIDLLASPDSPRELALTYVEIRIFSAPAVLINFAIVGWLIARQQTRWPMLITLFGNLLNILLDVVFILGLEMNSEGAAWASLAAEYCSCLLALWVLRQQLRHAPGHMPIERLKQWRSYGRLLQLNQQLFIRTVLLLATFAFFTAQGAAQGESVLAANNLLLQLLLLMSFGLDGIAHATEALVGSSIGQRNQRQFMRHCKACTLWSLLIAIGFSLFFWLGQQPLLGLLTDLPEVLRSANDSYPWLVMLPLLAVWAYLLDGIFIGATRTHAMQLTMLIAVLAVYLPLWYFSRDWGNHGLWLAFCGFNLARGIGLGLYFIYYSHQQRWSKLSTAAPD